MLYRARQEIITTRGRLTAGSPERRFTGSLQTPALGIADKTTVGIATVLFDGTFRVSALAATATWGRRSVINGLGWPWVEGFVVLNNFMFSNPQQNLVNGNHPSIWSAFVFDALLYQSAQE